MIPLKGIAMTLCATAREAKSPLSNSLNLMKDPGSQIPKVVN